MIEYILIALAMGLDTFLVARAVTDDRKQRKLSKYPFVSFIIPTYNDQPSLKKSIESVYSSYNKKLELIVINDCSTDNTKEILKKLKKQYKFRIIENKKNLGKAMSVNKAAKKAKGEIIFILDSDLLLTKRLIQNLLARLQDEKVAAASGRYKPVGKDLLSSMQEIGYGWQAVWDGATNASIIGGCFAVKKEAFKKAHFFTKEALLEDWDLANKLKKQGFRIEQSLCPAPNYPHHQFKKIVRQELRWSNGTVQMGLKNIKSPLKSRFSAIFFFFTLIIIALLVAFIKIDLNCHEKYCQLYQIAPIFISLPLLFLPFCFINQRKVKKIYPLMTVIPFGYIYVPIALLLSVWGFPKAIYNLLTYKKGQTAWQKQD